MIARIEGGKLEGRVVAEDGTVLSMYASQSKEGKRVWFVVWVRDGRWAWHSGLLESSEEARRLALSGIQTP